MSSTSTNIDADTTDSEFKELILKLTTDKDFSNHGRDNRRHRKVDSNKRKENNFIRSNHEISDSQTILTTSSYDDEEIWSEIDARLSRNSIDYPDLSNKTDVKNWLKGNSNCHKDDNEIATTSDKRWGKIIGIRGFSKRNKRKIGRQILESAKNKKSEKTNCFPTTNHYQHLLLRHKYLKLIKSYQHMMKKLKHVKSPKKCCYCSSPKKNTRRQYTEQVDNEICDEERGFGAINDDNKQKNNNFTNIHNIYGKIQRDDIDMLVEKIKKLEDYQSSGKKTQLKDNNDSEVILLKKENLILKEKLDIKMEEFKMLYHNYGRLNTKLESIVGEKQFCDKRDGRELRDIHEELTRLKVEKLNFEKTIDIESKIKEELNLRIDKLCLENKRLEKIIENNNRDMMKAKCEADNFESSIANEFMNEFNMTKNRLVKCKFELNSTKQLLNETKFKLSQLEVLFDTKVSQVCGDKKRQIDELNEKNVSLECEVSKLSSTIARQQNDISKLSKENEKLNDNLIQLTRQIEYANLSQYKHDENVSRQLKNETSQVERLRKKLDKINETNILYYEENELLKSKLNSTLNTCRDLKQKFEFQQKTFDRYKTKVNKQMQVATNNSLVNKKRLATAVIEKELRDSLRELEQVRAKMFYPLITTIKSKITATTNRMMAPSNRQRYSG